MEKECFIYGCEGEFEIDMKKTGVQICGCNSCGNLHRVEIDEKGYKTTYNLKQKDMREI